MGMVFRSQDLGVQGPHHYCSPAVSRSSQMRGMSVEYVCVHVCVCLLPEAFALCPPSLLPLLHRFISHFLFLHLLLIISLNFCPFVVN